MRKIVTIAVTCFACMALLLQTACSDGNVSPTRGSYDFEQVDTLHSYDMIKLDSTFLRPWTLSITGDLLAVYSSYDPPYFINIFDIKTGKHVKSMASLGKGPGEISGGGSISYDPMSESVTIWDSPVKILNYPISSDTGLCNYTSVRAPSKISLGMQHLRDSLFISLNSTPESMYSLVSNNNNVIRNFMDFPDDGKTVTAGKALAYQGNFLSNHDKTRFVYSSSKSDLFEIYSWDGDSLRVIASRMTHLPDYTDNSSQGMTGVTCSADNKNGFGAISLSNKYIYATHSGRSYKSHADAYYYSNEVYVMDWDGNMIRKYVLGSDIFTMCVNADDSKMYAARYVRAEDGEENCEILSFDLPK